MCKCQLAQPYLLHQDELHQAALERRPRPNSNKVLLPIKEAKEGGVREREADVEHLTRTQVPVHFISS